MARALAMNDHIQDHYAVLNVRIDVTVQQIKFMARKCEAQCDNNMNKLAKPAGAEDVSGTSVNKERLANKKWKGKESEAFLRQEQERRAREATCKGRVEEAARREEETCGALCARREQ
jgi:hypothetical protein